MPATALKRARTCIGCSKQSTKTDFLRIVRTSDGAVRYDATGREAGRGAYVCNVKCLETAHKARRLQKALRTNVDQEQVEAIIVQITCSSDEQEAR